MTQTYQDGTVFEHGVAVPAVSEISLGGQSVHLQHVNYTVMIIYSDNTALNSKYPALIERTTTHVEVDSARHTVRKPGQRGSSSLAPTPGIRLEL